MYFGSLSNKNKQMKLRRTFATISGRHTGSPVRYVFSFRIFGDLKNYTFLETLGYTESEKQCLHFFQAPYGRHLRFSKWRLFFSEIRQYLSF